MEFIISMNSANSFVVECLELFTWEGSSCKLVPICARWLYMRNWCDMWQWMMEMEKSWYCRKTECYPWRYIAEPDHFLHLNGFKNGKFGEMMEKLDLLVRYINDKLEKDSDLSKRLNIILTADHGHAEVFGTIFLFLFWPFINFFNYHRKRRSFSTFLVFFKRLQWI